MREAFKEGDKVLWQRAHNTSNAHEFPRIPAVVHRLKLDKVAIMVTLPDGKSVLKYVVPATLERVES